MRTGQIKSIFLKEILDTLRDRRTIMIMIVIPVILYPALMLFINDVATSQQAKMEQKTITVALVNVPEDSLLLKRLRAESRIKIVSGKDALEKVKSGQVHFVLEAPKDLDEILAERGTANIRLSYDRANEDASINLD